MAVGIGLVFGVLRLVNFAYGQLIMAGAYTLAFTSDWPTAGSIAACFVVVIALSLAMERAVFRPLRTQSPAVMLVTTFAVAFLLQNVALILDIRDGTIGEPAASLAQLNQVVTIGGVDVRKVTILAVVGRGRRARAACAAAREDDDRPAHARRVGRLPHRAAARRPSRHRDRRRRAALRRARGDGGRDPHRPVPARLARTSRSRRRSSSSSASSSEASTGSGPRRSGASRSGSRPA